MARELKNIGILNPSANTRTLAFEQGTSGLYLCSVIVTNNAMISSNQLLPGRNAYETHRFTLDYNDEIYITSTSGSVSFLISGVNQTE
jgi:hypothetical protein